MDLIPAIDLLGGKVVRLSQGKYDRVKVYHEDPLQPLEGFLEAGVRVVHVVDLDAARGQPTTANDQAIQQLASHAPGSIQTGGGVRSRQRVLQLQDLGVKRVVAGTVAIRDPEQVCAWAEEWQDGVVAALDARDGCLQAHGWQQAEASVDDVAKYYLGSKLAAILVTDIALDGMLTGPNWQLAEQVASLSALPAIVSGGIASYDDLLYARHRHQSNGGQFAGVIIGRAYYENKITSQQIGTLQREWDAHA